MISLLLLSSVFSTAVFAQDCQRIYLVRHAEKELSGSDPYDPALTPCGHERAASLAGFFDEVTLDAVYSTDFKRTLDTAKPIAESKRLETELYDHGNLADFSEMLTSRNEDVLVVGHSNSTISLIGLLMDDTEEEPIPEDEYDRIYMLLKCGDSYNLTLIRSEFNCTIKALQSKN